MKINKQRKLDKERKKFLKHLKEATRIVNSWPKWKRDAARSAMRPYND